MKTRNPIEHGFKLENEKGSIVHRLDDGYNLIMFNQFKVKELKRINGKKVLMPVPLEWYVHNEDLKIMGA